MVLEVILAASTLAGGGAAIWFFADKARTVRWKRPHFEKRGLEIPSFPQGRIKGTRSRSAMTVSIRVLLRVLIPSPSGIGSAEGFSRFGCPTSKDDLTYEAELV